MNKPKNPGRRGTTAVLAAGLLAISGLAAGSASAADGRPDCPDYVERNSDWVQFAFVDGEAGATWNKTGVMTQNEALPRAEAARLARRMQVCFSAPYSFPTRPGYRLGRNGDFYAGVLPDCTSRTRPQNPCLVSREIVEVKGGWVVRLTFTVPASAQDPKALG